MAQKITPNLWFNGNAEEAAQYYTAIFPDSSVIDTQYYPQTAQEGLADFQLDMAGKALTVEVSLTGHNFVLINAGPEFTPNPSISFMVNFDPSRDNNAKQNLDDMWQKLMDGGQALMPLDKYPFSEWYGWVKDKYGITWQLILTDPDGDERPFIIPSLMFGGAAQNRAAEAIDFYLEVFSNTKAGLRYPYGEPTGPAGADNLMFAEFQIENQWFVANDSGVEQPFTFNEAISLEVRCKDQAEIDHLWEKLSSVPESEQCGWCKDKFGVSWQIVPENMGELMQRPGAYSKMMAMKKLVIADF